LCGGIIARYTSIYAIQRTCRQLHHSSSAASLAYRRESIKSRTRYFSHPDGFTLSQLGLWGLVTSERTGGRWDTQPSQRTGQFMYNPQLYHWRMALGVVHSLLCPLGVSIQGIYTMYIAIRRGKRRWTVSNLGRPAAPQQMCQSGHSLVIRAGVHTGAADTLERGSCYPKHTVEEPHRLLDSVVILIRSVCPMCVNVSDPE
jgi:hypothetical protein